MNNSERINILVAIDEIEFSSHILKTACRYLNKDKTIFHILNVIESNTDKDELFLKKPEEYIKEESDKGNYDIFLDYLEEHGYKYKPILYEEGKPADIILKHSKEINAGLIVVGSHNKKGFERFLIGSTSYKVIRDSSTSVLVVKPSFNPIYGKDSTIEILTGIEDIEASDKISKECAQFIENQNTNFSIMHVRTPIESVLPTDAVHYADIASINAESEKIANFITEEAQKAFINNGLNTPESIVKFGNPDIQILNEMKDKEYDLVMLGSHGKDNLSNFLMGSVSTKVYENSKKSVLIIKNIF